MVILCHIKTNMASLKNLKLENSLITDIKGRLPYLLELNPQVHAASPEESLRLIFFSANSGTLIPLALRAFAG